MVLITLFKTHTHTQNRNIYKKKRLPPKNFKIPKKKLCDKLLIYMFDGKVDF